MLNINFTFIYKSVQISTKITDIFPVTIQILYILQPSRDTKLVIKSLNE